MTAPDPTGGDKRNAAYVAVARQLRENGFSPVPLCDKRPTIPGWPAIFCERLPSLDEIEREWSSGRRGKHMMNGVGVATADGLVIVDIDDDAAVERVLAIIPQARAAPACVGQRGRKIFVRASDGANVRERNITGASTGGALEILSWHRQGVVPATVHAKSGRPYVWIDDKVTLLSTPLRCLPTITDAEIEVLRAAFGAMSEPPVAEANRPAPRRRAQPEMTSDPSFEDPASPRWWEASANREEIEELFRLFAIVHRAARDRGGRIVIHAEGTDAAGKPHRPETIDINATGHWKHVVRIIVDVLGNSQEAYQVHIEVSRGNQLLGLPGGPETYDQVGNKRFFDTVVAAQTYRSTSGKAPRTSRSLRWWAREIEGRPPALRHVRKEGRLATYHQTFARLRAAGVEENVAAARERAASRFRSGSAKFAVIQQALDEIAGNGGRAWLQDLHGVAASHGITVRAVQLALAQAERAGILVRVRGNEGGKHILLTVPVLVERDASGNNEDGKCSPSLLRSRSLLGGTDPAAGIGNATFEQWMSPQVEDIQPPPFGAVRRSTGDDEQIAFAEFVEEVRRGRCTEETLLLTGILPPEASHVLLQVVEQNRAGKKAGAKWLRHIAGEVGELVLREPERWPWQLQGALDYVADRMERTRGRPTPCKWLRIFAQNLGFVHERAGRLTPMARAAAEVRLRWERARRTEAAVAEESRHSDGRGS